MSKNDFKLNIIWKVFFICEPFITVINNTNSYVTKGCEKIHSESAKVRTNNKKNLGRLAKQNFKFKWNNR